MGKEMFKLHILQFDNLGNNVRKEVVGLAQHLTNATLSKNSLNCHYILLNSRFVPILYPIRYCVANNNSGLCNC